MSVHIEMDEDYTQTTNYYGTLNEKYRFCVPVHYDSISEKYKTKRIKWTGEPLYKTTSTPYLLKRSLRIKAEKKIKNFLTKWLYDKLEDEENE